MIKRTLFGGSGAATPLGDVGWAVLRISVGLFIAMHGYGKFIAPSGIIEGTKGLGFPAPTVFGWCVIFAELVCGLLFALGLLTRFASAVLLFNMGVAAFVAHAGLPFVTWEQGVQTKELPMMYLFVFLAFLLAGAGRISLDALFHGPRRVVTVRRGAVGVDEDLPVIEPTRRVV